MEPGIVKFYNPEKGFGFIGLPDGREVFVHHSVIPGEGYRLLVQGEPVLVEVAKNEERDGWRATSVNSVPGRVRGRVSNFFEDKGYGFITVDTTEESVFFHYKDLLGAEKVKRARPEELVEFEIEEQEKGNRAVRVKRLDGRAGLLQFANLGPEQKWTEALASVAEPENWDYSSNPTGELPILWYYLVWTFDRLKEENKLAFGHEGDRPMACFNTGLVTVRQEPIFALFSDNVKKTDSRQWFLQGFYPESDKRLLGKFTKLPELANYFEDPGVLLYDRRCELVINVEHIVHDNLSRFPEPIRESEFLAQNLLESARKQTEQRVYRNYKAAIPQFYQGGVQLLLPICLLEPDKADLALVVSRPNDGMQYLGNTVLPLDWAYKNARLLCRPDTEWLIP